MTTEQLERANEIDSRIKFLEQHRDAVGRAESLNGDLSIKTVGATGTLMVHHVDEKLVDFQAIKKQVLIIIDIELANLKTEFKRL